MVINAQEVGDPRIHTVAQANIKNPRSLEDKVDKVVESIGKGIKSIFGKKNK